MAIVNAFPMAIKQDDMNNYIQFASSNTSTSMFSYSNGKIVGIMSSAFAYSAMGSSYFNGYLETAVFNDVLSIGMSAFESQHSMSKISFPECTLISNFAFRFCKGLSEAIFSKCETIGPNAFAGCEILEKISFPVCTSVGASAFLNCSNLNSVYLPMCSSFGTSVFANCSLITTLNLPAISLVALRSVMGSSQNNNIKSVYIENATSITSTGFGSWTKLETLYAPNCTVIQGATSTTGTYSAYYGYGAFVSCSALSVLSFPKLESITYHNAFINCRNLISLYLMNSVVCTLSNSNAFSYTPMLNSTYTGNFGSIYVPASLLATYKTTGAWAYLSARLVGI